MGGVEGWGRNEGMDEGVRCSKKKKHKLSKEDKNSREQAMAEIVYRNSPIALSSDMIHPVIIS